MCQKIKRRIQALRKEMYDSKIAAIVVPNCDPHNSEYLADHWKKMTWISGFTGSAGTVVITQRAAGLWTDARYFVQAEMELQDTDIMLQKMGLLDDNTPLLWLTSHLSPGDRITMSGDMWSQESIQKYIDQLSPLDIEVVTSLDLVSQVWIEDRPPIPTDPLTLHDTKYAGQSAQQKLALIRAELQHQNIPWHLITTLDDIAWICNLRGTDVSFNPVFLAYMLIGSSTAYLYIDTHKQTPEILSYLDSAGIVARDYDRLPRDLATVSEPILINPVDCNSYLYRQVSPSCIIKGETISRKLKAIKNPIESRHIEHMMVKDGIALVHAFYWLEQHIDSGSVTEAVFADQIAHYRSLQEGYYGESFPAIIGYRSNGAINHYRPHHDTALTLEREGILLCDSGGQYVDGTSDITRTIALGIPTQEQKIAFTLVLKGHIALDSIHYPEGTTGSQLDVLARQYLWQAGLNYGHGTGHGVGFFMNVHEPPQGFAPGKSSRATTPLQPGMLTSNEPGYYKNGAFGIRIENLVITQESSYEGFLCHHNVTLYPIDLHMIDSSLLSSQEIDWINNYHIKVYAALSPFLKDPLKSWFEVQCGLLS